MIQKNIFNAILLLSPLLMGACDNSLKEDKRNDEEKIIEGLINSKKWTYTKSEGVYHVVVQPSYGYEVNYGDTDSSGIRATPSVARAGFRQPTSSRRLFWQTRHQYRTLNCLDHLRENQTY